MNNTIYRDVTINQDIDEMINFHVAINLKWWILIRQDDKEKRLSLL